MKQPLSILMLSCLLCTSCGQKGSLYLPQDPIDNTQSLASDQGLSKSNAPPLTQLRTQDDEALFDFNTEPTSTQSEDRSVP